MNDVLTWILDVVRHVDPALRLLIVLLGMFCETSILIGLIVPGDTIVLVSSTAIGITSAGQGRRSASAGWVSASRTSPRRSRC